MGDRVEGENQWFYFGHVKFEMLFRYIYIVKISGGHSDWELGFKVRIWDWTHFGGWGIGLYMVFKTSVLDQANKMKTRRKEAPV